MMRRVHGWGKVLLVAVMLLMAMAVLADGIAIDGFFTDWAGKACLTDPGGADDETSPARADITQFCVDASSAGLYLLKAWDDTSFTGGIATTAGVTVQMPSGQYYRVYTTASGNPGSVLLSSLDINRCADATCGSQTDICTGTGCTGAQAGSGTSWSDPFASRSSPQCAGTNCGTRDTAVELYVPWSWFGGAPSSGTTTFFDFGSYPSGPGQAPKDATGTLACRSNNGTYICGFPTAVTLVDFTATWVGRGVLLRWETAMELDTVGFNLYRAASLGEEPVRVNASLILSKGLGGLEGAQYAYFDASPLAQDVAYYWLEDIDASRGATRHGPLTVSRPAVAQSLPVFFSPVIRRGSITALGGKATFGK